MRIVRYPLEIVDFQQVQPLWPGRVLSVGIGVEQRRREVPADGLHGAHHVYDPTIDMWCIDNDANRGDRLAPVLGVWIVGTGNPIDPAMLAADALFHGTVDMRANDAGAWHVFTAVVGEAERPEPVKRPEYGSVDEMVDEIRARRLGRGLPGEGR
ncbi:DUF7352 domain-containing protein [Mycolicibacterium psychrotolerans]|uniref:DUF7352 domain-containing protein n=1 Tax=Mycolicibacterium psychrotolerans TaxID=216929 RepID=UPI003D66E274